LQARFRMQALERDSERIRVARLARASRPRRRALLATLVGWLSASRAAATASRGTLSGAEPLTSTRQYAQYGHMEEERSWQPTH
jgi:hypothetical protein